MQAMNFTRRRILITGASSGLGLAMAKLLANRDQADLVLVARRLDRLNELKAELEGSTGISCQVIAADLSKPQDVERVFTEATAAGEVYGVILNAGVTHFGNHLDMEWSAFEAMLATNVTSVVRLVSLFTPYLREKGQGGGVMLVSSMAGLLPVPFQSAYAGTKAFITNFAQSLAEELRGQPVSVTVFSPGGIDTAMTRDSQLRYFENTALLQDVDSCARDGLEAMRRRDGIAVPGLLNRAQLFATRLAPRKLITFITGTTYRKALKAGATGQEKTV
ncbi:MAG TPA: SDR family NAD(P)-dependent oxidoreductase [Fluviicoccus sp.]|nr:SDR family NAD(P)-dependent oxidoreductase [Fluviicoccus sp.]